MPNPSLADLLTAVERWQRDDLMSTLHTIPDLHKIDIPALRAACQQHGEALRELAYRSDGSGVEDDDEGMLEVAADFLGPQA